MSIENCVECNICVKECEFLLKYGNPLSVAEKLKKNSLIAFECSLCGLCEAVCKKGVKFVDFILSQREKAVKDGLAPLKEHKRVLNFEKNASSNLFTIYNFKENSKKLFFPGCAFTGNSPEMTINVYEKLQEIINEPVSIAIDCCFKISHDLGLKEKFVQKNNEKIQLLKNNNIEEIITVCASCTQIFKKYMPFKVKTIYEYLAEVNFFPNKNENFSKVHIHDPCSLRFNGEVHESIRKITKKLNIEITPMKHEKEKTFCCGEGGAAGFINRNYAKSWKKKRLNESEYPLIVYCYGCKFFLKNKTLPVVHILDILFNNKKEIGKLKYWWNKWRVRRELKKNSVEYGVRSV